MRPRPVSADHQAAVSRRLATLSAELASLRGSAPGGRATAPAPPYGTEGEPDLSEHTRVRSEPPDLLAGGVPLAPDEPAVPSALPVPGRHAHRRRRVTLLPSPAHLAVVAALVALGLGVTTWLLVGGRPREVAAPAVEATFSAATTDSSPTPVEPEGESAVGATTPAAEAGSEVTVDVAGKVRRPGIAVLPAGARVVDAIEAAGGARRGTDLSTLNLARVLLDGEQVLVGVEAPPPVAGLTSGGQAPAGALVNINVADQAELETLPGIGPVTAGAILAWRAEHGSFTSVEELVEVDGIGDATLARLAPLVTV